MVLYQKRFQQYNFNYFFSMNTMRLWLPQIFASMDEYQQLHPHNENAGFCDVIYSNSSITQIKTKCFVVNKKQRNENLNNAN